MKAVVYHKPYELAVENVPDPVIMTPDEVILRVTSTAICGSDLHLFHGLVQHTPEGQVLGHEFMGIVEEVGKGVTKWKKGDRILVPFPIACGVCPMCRAGQWSACLNSNVHGEMGAIFGYGESYGGIPGGQAEYVRVPYADVSPVGIPEDLSDKQVLFLSDVLPTAYWIIDVSGVKPGDSVAVFGCGPIGQMAIRCAIFKGAKRVIAVDQIPYRLEMAQKLHPGVEVINFTKLDPGEKIKELTGNIGADVVIDAVGFESEPTGPVVAALAGMKQIGIPPLPGTRPEDEPPAASISAINWAVKAVRQGGTIGIAGVYGGRANNFPIGDIFAKGITIKTGQALVQNYLGELLGYIKDGRLRADDMITHEIALNNAIEGYEKFGRRLDNCLKVVMHPTH